MLSPHNESDGPRAGCRQFDLNLEAYLEGEARPKVAEHARECAYCAVMLADLEQIRFASRHLPLPEPSPRVWANIRASLAAEGIIREQIPAWRRWIPHLRLLQSPGPISALAGLAVLALTLLGLPEGFQILGPSDIPSGGETATVTAAVLPHMSSDLTRTLREMEAAYQARESSFEPALKESYKKSLDTLDATIEECARHCQREPGNALARQYLMHAYQSKAEVLASALESSGR